MRKMNKLIGFMLLAAIMISCRNSGNVGMEQGQAGERMLVAKDIIYDVVIRVLSEDDPWEAERLQGYNGDEMINSIFDAVYDGKIKAYEYFSNKELSPSDIKEMERVPGFDRKSIGKIQFTEDWYFNKSTLGIEKDVKSIVLGYESRDPNDSTLIGYKAAFRLDFR